MKRRINLIKNEDGAVVILVALAFVVLLSIVALVLDLGRVYIEKENLQNAADAAALAGAQVLPDAITAENTAIYYANLNAKEEIDTTVTAPYMSNPKRIEVVCKKTVQYYFARVIGFTEKEVFARAVAEKGAKWAGDALPFINLDDDYLATPPPGTPNPSGNPEVVIWEKTMPGDKERISDYKIINEDDPQSCYFQVNYTDGVVIKEGKVETIKQEIKYIYERSYPDKPVYVISLSSSVLASGRVLLTDGTYRIINEDKNHGGLKENDVIDPSQFVLLKCLFYNYDYQNAILYLSVLDTYDIMNNEFPEDYVNPAGGNYKLID